MNLISDFFSGDDKLTFVEQQPSASQLLSRSVQAGLILDSHATHVVIDLAHQPAQNFSWSNFNKALYTLAGQKSN